MSIIAPPRSADVGDAPAVDQEALIKEARRRAQRRRQRNLAGAVAAILGVLWLFSLLGGGGHGSGVFSETAARNAASVNVALPEEFSYNTNGGIVLVRRDGTQRFLAAEVDRRPHNGAWLLRLYSGIEWSPDGSRLLALRRGGPSSPALVVVDANGKVSPPIASHALDGRWSPDGTRIAFVRHEHGLHRVLYVASSDGRTVTRVADQLQTFGGFSWSPDGTELAYSGQGASGLFIADVSGRGARRPVRITVPPGAPAMQVAEVQWSPDGSLIALTSGGAASGVYVVRPDGTALRRITDAADGWWYGIVWSPDSRLLAVAGPAGATFGDVSVVHADGTGVRRIARCSCGLGVASGQSVAWSPDGSRIAYISGRGNTVSTIRPDGSGATLVATQPTPSRGLLPGWPLWRPLSAS